MKTPVYFVYYHTTPIMNCYQLKHIDTVIKGYLEDYEQVYMQNRHLLECVPNNNWYPQLEMVSRPENTHLEELANG